MATGTTHTPVKKKSKDSAFIRINKWLHLWLGLASGVIVLIVCITGCIWVFNEEITALMEPETRIEKQDKRVISPSKLQAIVTSMYPGKVIGYAQYLQGSTVNVTVRDPEERGRRGGGTTLKLNPYTGAVLKKEERKKGDADFFRFILNGHRFLWMPAAIGRPIVNYGTLVFVILLITGMIWWYPKKWNSATRDKSFKIKWTASFKRVNLDLHNVLGFYSLLFLLAIALSGMVYGIKWYSEGLYWVTSGGASLPEYKRLQSDTLSTANLYTPEQAMDLAWEKVVAKHPKSIGFYYAFPDVSKAGSTIDITVYPNAGQFYSSQGYTFDRHTLQPLKRNDVYSQAYAEANVAGKIRKMNYDIHIGSILGFPGKVLAFLATLIGASLPVTGFLIWYGRKFKKKGKKKSLMPDNQEMIPSKLTPQIKLKQEPVL
jgi:uncharacterized iron-regulated membrane protein